MKESRFGWIKSVCQIASMIWLPCAIADLASLAGKLLWSLLSR